MVFNGEVLQEGVDYTWTAWGSGDSRTDPGEYDVTLFGKGRFAGYAQVHYAIQPAPEPEPGPEPGPEPDPSPVPAATTKLSFDLAGGTLDGRTGTIVIEAERGSVIDIPAAPAREGYTFLYWEGSRYYPGDTYTVTGDHTFTAVWKQSTSSDDPEQPAPDPSANEGDEHGSNGGTTSDDTANGGGNGTNAADRASSPTRLATPRTGDPSGMLAPMLALIALVSLAAGVMCSSRRH